MSVSWHFDIIKWCPWRSSQQIYFGWGLNKHECSGPSHSDSSFTMAYTNHMFLNTFNKNIQKLRRTIYYTVQFLGKVKENKAIETPCGSEAVECQKTFQSVGICVVWLKQFITRQTHSTNHTVSSYSVAILDVVALSLKWLKKIYTLLYEYYLVQLSVTINESVSEGVCLILLWLLGSPRLQLCLACSFLPEEVATSKMYFYFLKKIKPVTSASAAFWACFLFIYFFIVSLQSF